MPSNRPAAAARIETRRRARKFVLALLADLPRKNCWTIVEHAGEPDPHGMQNFPARASWDTDGVHGDLRVGVQRQYTGTAGLIENAQVAVHLVYAGRRGHAMIGHELYLPKSWTSDADRCAAAGVPGDIAFASKPGSRPECSWNLAPGLRRGG